MRMKKLAVLIMGTMFFWNLHAGLVTHLKFDGDWEDNYGESTYVKKWGTSFTDGKEGQAANFGSDDFINVGLDNDFHFRNDQGEYSISMWIYPTTTSSDCYIGKHDEAGGNLFLFGYYSSQLYINVGGSVTYISETLPINTWTHYVVTADEGSTSTYVKIYKNGSLLWSGTKSGVAPPAANAPPEPSYFRFQYRDLMFLHAEAFRALCLVTCI
jgi:hypothetical protein